MFRCKSKSDYHFIESPLYCAQGEDVGSKDKNLNLFNYVCYHPIPLYCIFEILTSYKIYLPENNILFSFKLKEK